MLINTLGLILEQDQPIFFYKRCYRYLYNRKNIGIL